MENNQKDTHLRKFISQKRLWLFNLIIVTVAFGISLLLIEITLRLHQWYNAAQYQEEESPYDFSATRHHQLLPNVHWRHKEVEYDYIWMNNSLGMRDRERSLKKDPQSFRIFFLGDSMVQGYGVSQEHMMTTLLEESLNDPKREKTVEVLNGGVFGYSPLLEYLYLKEVMPLIEPDMVIVGFFLGNDVGDDYFYARQVKVGTEGKLFFNDERWPWSRLNELLDKSKTEAISKKQSEGSDELQRQSYLSGAWARVQPILMKSRLVKLTGEVIHTRYEIQELRERRAFEREFVKEHKDDIQINLGLINYPVLDQEQRLKYWDLSKGYLTNIHQLCQEHDIPMVIVVIPGDESAGFNEPYEILDEMGLEFSIPVIHLLSEFRQQPTDKIYYPLDGHWTPEGNQLVATILDRELRQLSLLPP